MNDTLNRILGGMAGVANTTVKVTGDLVQKGKQQVNLMSLENQLSRAQGKLGDAVYGQIKAGAVNTDELAPMVSAIDELHTKISRVKADKMQAGTPKTTVTKMCPICGAEVEEGAMFCSGCGNKL